MDGVEERTSTRTNWGNRSRGELNKGDSDLGKKMELSLGSPDTTVLQLGTFSFAGRHSGAIASAQHAGCPGDVSLSRGIA